jgi:hypothetical protein
MRTRIRWYAVFKGSAIADMKCQMEPQVFQQRRTPVLEALGIEPWDFPHAQYRNYV